MKTGTRVVLTIEGFNGARATCVTFREYKEKFPEEGPVHSKGLKWFILDKPVRGWKMGGFCEDKSNLENILVLEEVYDSPLYQALKEE